MSPCFSLILLAIDLDNSTISLAYQETQISQCPAQDRKACLKLRKQA